MIFTVELHGLEGHFRLQKDNLWRKCSPKSGLQPSDFTTSAKIEGVQYEVNRDEVSFPSDRRYLSDASCVFRREYPGLPSCDQLRQVIAAGDDRFLNCLVLNVDGRFELRQVPPFDFVVNDPTYVVRHESFGPGNGYVGSKAAQDAQLISDYYEDSLVHWRNHLTTHETQAYSDQCSREEPSQVRRDILKIEQNWKAEY